MRRLKPLERRGDALAAVIIAAAVVAGGFVLGLGWVGAAVVLVVAVQAAVQGREKTRKEVRERRAMAAMAVISLGFAVVGLVLLLATHGRSRENGALALVLGGLYAISFGLHAWGRSIGAPSSRVDEAYLATLVRWMRTRHD
jgi:NADH:ubiquinone oxidoreductase subunit 6 (subunit J)